MSDDPAQLHVPDPDEVGPDGEGPLETLALAGVLSVMFTLGIAILSTQPSSSEAPDSTRAADSAAEHERSDSPAPPAKQLAERLAALSDRQARDIAWEDRQVDAVLSYGPRRLAEDACHAVYTGPTDINPAAIEPDLISLVDRRARHTPWSCLFRQYFEGRLNPNTGLHDNLDSLWRSKIRLFRRVDLPLDTVVASWHPVNRGPPDHKEVIPWLRLCALQYDYQADGVCQQVLAGIAPEQGRDLLMAAEMHLRQTEPLNPSYDLPRIIDGLGSLANQGQPEGWRILQTESMPDYDADIRIAASFFLCRFVHSPNHGLAEQAAAELGNAAGYTVRMVNESLRRRWLRSCKLAFKTAGTQQSPKAPALRVTTDNPDAPPDYTLKAVIERQQCEANGPEPPWYCAIRMYNAGTVAELDDFFVQSRGLQTHDIEW